MARRVVVAPERAQQRLGGDPAELAVVAVERRHRRIQQVRGDRLVEGDERDVLRHATGLLRGLREQGLRVPQDVALVSFDQPVSADLLDRPMTSLDRHDSELGRIAAETLLRALRGDDDAAGHTVRVTSALTVRRSCGCNGQA